jgi:hypothetical protein
MNVLILAGKYLGLVLHAPFLQEPSLGEESIGEGGETSRVPMNAIGRDDRVVAFGEEAMITEQSLAIYRLKVGPK